MRRKRSSVTSREALEVYWRLKGEYGAWVPLEVLTKAVGSRGPIDYLLTKGRLERRNYGGRAYVKAEWVKGEWPPRADPRVIGADMVGRVKEAEAQLLTISRMAEKYARMVNTDRGVPAKDLMASYESLKTLLEAYELLVKDTVYLAKKAGLV